jgi:hypothetical protein
VLGVPAQLQVRSPGGHGDDIRKADQIVAASRRPGDVMLYYTIGEPIVAAYPYGLRQLPNAELARTAIQSGTLGGTWAASQVVRRRAARAPRVWLVQLNSLQSTSLDAPPTLLRRLGFGRIRIWQATAIWLSLYAR